MSTRATYQFGPTGIKTNPTFFYVHHDGYPRGAARYFQNMLDCENKGGGLAEQFIRANEGAEFTQDHQTHGDTEYRYNIDRKNGQAYIKCFKRCFDSCNGKKWVTAFVGPAAQFLELYPPAFD